MSKKTKEPRAYTAEEARTMFLKQVLNIARYWADLPDKQTARERCEGAAFSILVLLDGGSAMFPAFDLRVHPHPDDAAYCIEHGENYYEPNMLINNCELHEEFVGIEKKGKK